jgi:hypothetical protein
MKKIFEKIGHTITYDDEVQLYLVEFTKQLEDYRFYEKTYYTSCQDWTIKVKNSMESITIDNVSEVQLLNYFRGGQDANLLQKHTYYPTLLSISYMRQSFNTVQASLSRPADHNDWFFRDVERILSLIQPTHELVQQELVLDAGICDLMNIDQAVFEDINPTLLGDSNDTSA